MGHKLSSLSVLFVLLLFAFSPVLGENQGPKDANVNQFKGDKHGGGHGYGYGGSAVEDHHAPCKHCGNVCCSDEEYAEYVKKVAEDHHAPCKHCGNVCCSDEEYAEYVKKGAEEKYGH